MDAEQRIRKLIADAGYPVMKSVTQEDETSIAREETIMNSLWHVLDEIDGLSVGDMMKTNFGDNTTEALIESQEHIDSVRQMYEYIAVAVSQHRNLVNLIDDMETCIMNLMNERDMLGYIVGAAASDSYNTGITRENWGDRCGDPDVVSLIKYGRKAVLDGEVLP